MRFFCDVRAFYDVEISREFFSIPWTRSEWDGKSDAGMEGRETACLAALSTFLLS